MWIKTIVFKNGDENHNLKYCQKNPSPEDEDHDESLHFIRTLRCACSLQELDRENAATLRAINLEHTTDKRATSTPTSP